MQRHPAEEEEVTDAARRIDSEELRSKYLQDVCGDDAAMLERIRQRLQVEENEESPGRDASMLTTPLQNLSETADLHGSNGYTPSGPPSSMKPGSEIAGRYKLLEVVGEGGMGSVWLAEQSQPVKRRVAIKLIKPGMDSQQVLARFEAERQALAVMDHPNIAKVLDGGLTDWQRPFFAMEYVKGVPLTAYCNRARLTVVERLELFIKVCAAVQHAHQKGIIHRDLKPSNILVSLNDGQAVPKVIDFGLAKAMHQSLTEQSLFMVHGMVLGTPLYMSPEQAGAGNLDIDTRTDIYSLGVILYELLCGSTPLKRQQFYKASVDQIISLITDFDPPKPSSRLSETETLDNVAAERNSDTVQLSRRLSGDLDWIVMKAMEKERGRRYETANGLAADIQRHLNDEPVTASPPSKRYRIQKFIRRNRTAVIAATLVAVALLVAVGGTTGGMLWALREKERAERAEEKTGRALTEKELALAAETVANQKKDAALQETRETIDQYVETVRNAELLKQEEFKPLLIELLRDALAHYQRFVKEHQHDRSMLHELLTAVTTIGSISDSSGDQEQAVKAFEQHIEMITPLVKEDPAYESQLAVSLNRLAILYQRKRNWDAARQAFRDCLEIQERLAQGRPDDTRRKAIIAATQGNLGSLYRTIRKPKEALQWFQKALATLEPLAEKDPQDQGIQSVLAITLKHLGVLYQRRNPRQARENLQRALSIYEKQLQRMPNDKNARHELVQVHLNLGNSYVMEGRFSVALRFYNVALKIVEPLCKENPTVTQFQNDLELLRAAVGHASVNMGGVAAQRNDWKRAEAHLDDAVDALDPLVARNPGHVEGRKWLLRAHVSRARVMERQNRLEKAVAEWGKAAALASGNMKTEMENRRAAAADKVRRALALHDWQRLLDQPADELPSLLETRGSEFVKQLRFGDAAQAAAKLLELKNVDKRQLYKAACIFSLCAASIKTPAGGELAADQLAQRQQWIDEALDALKASIAAGWTNLAYIARDPELAVLRDLPEFKELLKKDLLPQ